MHVIKTLLLILLVSFNALADSKLANKVVGFWATENDEGVVEVYKIKKKYFGKLVWIDVIHRGEEPEDSILDKENPDDKLKKRKLLGINLLSNFRYSSSGKKWKNGKIYDPENGKTYSSKMWFDDNADILNIRGFIGISLFGRTTEWRRLKTKLPPSYKVGGKNYIKYNLGNKK